MNRSHDPLHRMYSHMAWADSRTHGVLRAMAEPPPQALDLYAHTLTAEHIWLRRIDGVAATYDVWQPLSLDECERLARANRAGFQRVLDDDDRARVVAYHSSNGTPHRTPVDDILIHVSHHGMYHRGQIALLVRAAGGSPVGIDYIVFHREAFGID